MDELEQRRDKLEEEKKSKLKTKYDVSTEPLGTMYQTEIALKNMLSEIDDNQLKDIAESIYSDYSEFNTQFKKFITNVYITKCYKKRNEFIDYKWERVQEIRIKKEIKRESESKIEGLINEFNDKTTEYGKYISDNYEDIDRTAYNTDETEMWLTNQIQDKNTEISNIQNTIDSHKASIFTLETEINTLNTEISVLDTEISGLEDDVSAKQTEIDNETDPTEIERLNDELQTLENSLSTKKNTRDTKIITRDSKIAQKTDLNNLVATKESEKIAVIETRKDLSIMYYLVKITEQENIIAVAESEITNLNSEIDAKKSTLEDEIKNLKDTLEGYIVYSNAEKQYDIEEGDFYFRLKPGDLDIKRYNNIKLNLQENFEEYIKAEKPVGSELAEYLNILVNVDSEQITEEGNTKLDKYIRPREELISIDPETESDNSINLYISEEIITGDEPGFDVDMSYIYNDSDVNNLKTTNFSQYYPEGRDEEEILGEYYQVLVNSVIDKNINLKDGAEDYAQLKIEEFEIEGETVTGPSITFEYENIPHEKLGDAKMNFIKKMKSIRTMQINRELYNYKEIHDYISKLRKTYKNESDPLLSAGVTNKILSMLAGAEYDEVHNGYQDLDRKITEMETGIIEIPANVIQTEDASIKIAVFSNNPQYDSYINRDQFSIYTEKDGVLYSGEMRQSISNMGTSESEYMPTSVYKNLIEIPVNSLSGLLENEQIKVGNSANIFLSLVPNIRVRGDYKDITITAEDFSNDYDEEAEYEMNIQTYGIEDSYGDIYIKPQSVLCKQFIIKITDPIEFENSWINVNPRNMMETTKGSKEKKVQFDLGLTSYRSIDNPEGIDFYPFYEFTPGSGNAIYSITDYELLAGGEKQTREAGTATLKSLEEDRAIFQMNKMLSTDINSKIDHGIAVRNGFVTKVTGGGVNIKQEYIEGNGEVQLENAILKLDRKTKRLRNIPEKVYKIVMGDTVLQEYGSKSQALMKLNEFITNGNTSCELKEEGTVEDETNYIEYYLENSMQNELLVEDVYGTTYDYEEYMNRDKKPSKKAVYLKEDQIFLKMLIKGNKGDKYKVNIEGIEEIFFLGQNVSGVSTDEITSGIYEVELKINTGNTLTISNNATYKLKIQKVNDTNSEEIKRYTIKFAVENGETKVNAIAGADEKGNMKILENVRVGERYSIVTKKDDTTDHATYYRKSNLFQKARIKLSDDLKLYAKIDDVDMNISPQAINVTYDRSGEFNLIERVLVEDMPGRELDMVYNQNSRMITDERNVTPAIKQNNMDITGYGGLITDDNLMVYLKDKKEETGFSVNDHFIVRPANSPKDPAIIQVNTETVTTGDSIDLTGNSVTGHYFKINSMSFSNDNSGWSEQLDMEGKILGDNVVFTRYGNNSGVKVNGVNREMYPMDYEFLNMYLSGYSKNQDDLVRQDYIFYLKMLLLTENEENLMNYISNQYEGINKQIESYGQNMANVRNDDIRGKLKLIKGEIEDIKKEQEMWKTAFSTMQIALTLAVPANQILSQLFKLPTLIIPAQVAVGKSMMSTVELAMTGSAQYSVDIGGASLGMVVNEDQGIVDASASYAGLDLSGSKGINFDPKQFSLSMLMKAKGLNTGKIDGFSLNDAFKTDFGWMNGISLDKNGIGWKDFRLGLDGKIKYDIFDGKGGGYLSWRPGGKIGLGFLENWGKTLNDFSADISLSKIWDGKFQKPAWADMNFGYDFATNMKINGPSGKNLDLGHFNASLRDNKKYDLEWYKTFGEENNGDKDEWDYWTKVGMDYRGSYDPDEKYSKLHPYTQVRATSPDTIGGRMTTEAELGYIFDLENNTDVGYGNLAYEGVSLIGNAYNSEDMTVENIPRFNDPEWRLQFFNLLMKQGTLARMEYLTGKAKEQSNETLNKIAEKRERYKKDGLSEDEWEDLKKDYEQAKKKILDSGTKLDKFMVKYAEEMGMDIDPMKKLDENMNILNAMKLSDMTDSEFFQENMEKLGGGDFTGKAVNADEMTDDQVEALLEIQKEMDTMEVYDDKGRKVYSYEGSANVKYGDTEMDLGRIGKMPIINDTGSDIEVITGKDEDGTIQKSSLNMNDDQIEDYRNGDLKINDVRNIGDGRQLLTFYGKADKDITTKGNTNLEYMVGNRRESSNVYMVKNSAKLLACVVDKKGNDEIASAAMDVLTEVNFQPVVDFMGDKYDATLKGTKINFKQYYPESILGDISKAINNSDINKIKIELGKAIENAEAKVDKLAETMHNSLNNFAGNLPTNDILAGLYEKADFGQIKAVIDDHKDELQEVVKRFGDITGKYIDIIKDKGVKSLPKYFDALKEDLQIKDYFNIDPEAGTIKLKSNVSEVFVGKRENIKKATKEMQKDLKELHDEQLKELAGDGETLKSDLQNTLEEMEDELGETDLVSYINKNFDAKDPDELVYDVMHGNLTLNDTYQLIKLMKDKGDREEFLEELGIQALQKAMDKSGMDESGLMKYSEFLSPKYYEDNDFKDILEDAAQKLAEEGDPRFIGWKEQMEEYSEKFEDTKNEYIRGLGHLIQGGVINVNGKPIGEADREDVESLLNGMLKGQFPEIMLDQDQLKDTLKDTAEAYLESYAFQKRVRNVEDNLNDFLAEKEIDINEIPEDILINKLGVNKELVKVIMNKDNKYGITLEDIKDKNYTGLSDYLKKTLNDTNMAKDLMMDIEKYRAKYEKYARDSGVTHLADLDITTLKDLDKEDIMKMGEDVYKNIDWSSLEVLGLDKGSLDAIQTLMDEYSDGDPTQMLKEKLQEKLAEKLKEQDIDVDSIRSKVEEKIGKPEDIYNIYLSDPSSLTEFMGNSNMAKELKDMTILKMVNSSFTKGLLSKVNSMEDDLYEASQGGKAGLIASYEALEAKYDALKGQMESGNNAIKRGGSSGLESKSISELKQMYSELQKKYYSLLMSGKNLMTNNGREMVEEVLLPGILESQGIDLDKLQEKIENKKNELTADALKKYEDLLENGQSHVDNLLDQYANSLDGVLSNAGEIANRYFEGEDIDRVLAGVMTGGFDKEAMEEMKNQVVEVAKEKLENMTDAAREDLENNLKNNLPDNIEAEIETYWTEYENNGLDGIKESVKTEMEQKLKEQIGDLGDQAEEKLAKYINEKFDAQDVDELVTDMTNGMLTMNDAKKLMKIAEDPDLRKNLAKEMLLKAANATNQGVIKYAELLIDKNYDKALEEAAKELGKEGDYRFKDWKNKAEEYRDKYEKTLDRYYDGANNLLKGGYLTVNGKDITNVEDLIDNVMNDEKTNISFNRGKLEGEAKVAIETYMNDNMSDMIDKVNQIKDMDLEKIAENELIGRTGMNKEMAKVLLGKENKYGATIDNIQNMSNDDIINLLKETDAAKDMMNDISQYREKLEKYATANGIPVDDINLDNLSKEDLLKAGEKWYDEGDLKEKLGMYQGIIDKAGDLKAEYENASNNIQTWAEEKLAGANPELYNSIRESQTKVDEISDYTKMLSSRDGIEEFINSKNIPDTIKDMTMVKVMNSTLMNGLMNGALTAAELGSMKLSTLQAKYDALETKVNMLKSTTGNQAMRRNDMTFEELLTAYQALQKEYYSLVMGNTNPMEEIKEELEQLKEGAIDQLSAKTNMIIEDVLMPQVLSGQGIASDKLESVKDEYIDKYNEYRENAMETAQEMILKYGESVEGIVQNAQKIQDEYFQDGELDQEHVVFNLLSQGFGDEKAREFLDTMGISQADTNISIDTDSLRTEYGEKAKEGLESRIFQSNIKVSLENLGSEYTDYVQSKLQEYHEEYGDGTNLTKEQLLNTYQTEATEYLQEKIYGEINRENVGANMFVDFTNNANNLYNVEKQEISVLIDEGISIKKNIEEKIVNVESAGLKVTKSATERYEKLKKEIRETTLEAVKYLEMNYETKTGTKSIIMAPETRDMYSGNIPDEAIIVPEYIPELKANTLKIKLKIGDTLIE